MITNYLGQIWGGEVFDNSYDRGATSAFQIGVGKVVPGWDTALVGVPVGSRVMLSLPPADGYGPAGNSGAGITGTDTLVFVVDIVAGDRRRRRRPDRRDAADRRRRTGRRSPARWAAAPTVTMPAGTAEPTAPTVTVLATGTGAPVAAGPGAGPVHRGDLDRGERRDHLAEPTIRPRSGTGPQELPVATGGPFAGLVGVPLGSRVLVQVPGQTDQSTGQPQPAIAAVVDLLLQTVVTPPATASSPVPTAPTGG